MFLCGNVCQHDSMLSLTIQSHYANFKLQLLFISLETGCLKSTATNILHSGTKTSGWLRH